MSMTTTPTPTLFGRWMVTGPDFEDGSGWTLCLHVDGKCQRCLAEMNRQEDALAIARLLAGADDHAAAQSTLEVWTARECITQAIQLLAR